MLTKKTKDDLFMFGLWIFAMAGSILLTIHCIHQKFYLGALSGSGVLFFGVSVFLNELKSYFSESVLEASDREKHKEELKEREDKEEKSSVA